MSNIIPFPRNHPLKPSDPDALCVGRRVHCGLYGGMEGIVAAIHGVPAPSSVRSLMAGGCIVTGGRATVDVAFSARGVEHPAHLSRSIPEAIIYGVQWDIWPAKASAEELEKLLSEIRLNEAYNAAMKERAAKIAEDASRRGLAFLAPRQPSWATHAIVAQHQHNDSDIQTDYFASHTDETLLLAWSRHGRNLFPEMRKAAANAPETAHLGPDCGVFTVSLRWDHDSIGTRMHSGWQVRKVSVGHLEKSSLPHAVGLGGYRIPEKPGTPPLLEVARYYSEPYPPEHQREEAAPIEELPHRTEPSIPDRLRDRRAEAHAAIDAL